MRSGKVTPPHASAITRMKCPKCGFEQPQSEECRGCGIIIGRYLEIQAAGEAGNTRARISRSSSLPALKQVRAFYESQATMLGAGLAPGDAIKQFLSGLKDEKSRPEYRRLQTAIEEGSSYSAAMARSPSVFPAHHVAIVAAGEQTGDLGQVFTELYNLLDKQIELREQLTRQLRRPLITVLAAVVILPLPQWFSDGLLAYLTGGLVPLAVTTFALFVAIRIFARTVNARRRVEKLISLALVRDYYTNRFLRIYVALHAAGINSEGAWRVAANAIDNSFLNEVLASHEPMLAQGNTVTEVARATNAFSVEQLQRLSTAEASGTMHRSMTQYLVDAEADLVRRVDSLVRGLAFTTGILISAYIGYTIIDTYSGLVSPESVP